ncbi:MAG: ASKHA domain-containing protein [Promethearchaeota archaeon]
MTTNQKNGKHTGHTEQDLVTIIFEPTSKRIKISRNSTIYQAATMAGNLIQAYCGGAGICGKCKVQIKEDFKNKPNIISPLTDAEKKHLLPEEIEAGFRLACQTKVMSNIRVYIPMEARHLHHKILIDAKESNLEILPSTMQAKIFLTRKDIEKSRSILSAITKKCQMILLEAGYLKLGDPVSWDFSSVITNGLNIDSTIKAARLLLYLIPCGSDVFHIQVLSLSPLEHGLATGRTSNQDLNTATITGSSPEHHYGVAIDIGTTTIVMYLHDLITGRLLGVASDLNPQTNFGEDVVSRIQAAVDPGKRQKLKNLVIECINDLIRKCCQEANILPDSINEINAVGNTAMNHLLLGIYPASLAVAPYAPVIDRPITMPASHLGIKANRNARIFILPNIGGYVGSDTVANILATKIYNADEDTLLIDIGTNGEIVFGNKKKLITGSCAAGSAMEGAHVLFGMRGAEGAIERVRIDPESKKVEYDVIGNVAPIGFCGSGFIDAISEMLKANIITRSGKFNKSLIDDKELFTKHDGMPAFILVPAKDTPISQDIIITQDDVRELQKAKAAFYAGAKIIIEHVGKSINDIKKVLLAGAFGNYINPIHAKFIGLIPDVDDNKIEQIGNAAGRGCQMALLNFHKKEKAATVIEDLEYLELTIQKEFQKEYVLAMYFPHYNVSNFPSLVKEYENIRTR